MKLEHHGNVFWVYHFIERGVQGRSLGLRQWNGSFRVTCWDYRAIAFLFIRLIAVWVRVAVLAHRRWGCTSPWGFGTWTNSRELSSWLVVGLSEFQFRVIRRPCVVFYFLLSRSWLSPWLRSCSSSWSWRRCCSCPGLLRYWAWTPPGCHGVLRWVCVRHFWVCFFRVRSLFWPEYDHAVVFHRYPWA